MVYLIQGWDLPEQNFTLHKFGQLNLQHGLGSVQIILAPINRINFTLSTGYNGLRRSVFGALAKANIVKSGLCCYQLHQHCTISFSVTAVG
jgi:hypothetical protein